MPLDPLNYTDKNEYTLEVQKLPGYVKNDNAAYRDRYLRTARTYYDSQWAAKRKTMLQDPAIQKQYEGAEYKGAPWAGGAEYPKGFAPGEGGLPKEAWWDKAFAQNIGKPLHRVLETGLALAAASGPGALPNPEYFARDVWRNPGQYPAYRSISGAGGLVESPEGLAVLAAAVAMPEIAGAYGWYGFADAIPEAGYMGQVVNPALRFAARAGTMGATGAAINAPKSIVEGDPAPSIIGFLQNAGGQAASEVPGGVARGAVNLFGRGAMRMGYGESLANAITRYFPEFASSLRSESDFGKLFSPNFKDARGTAVTAFQQSSRQQISSLTNQARNAVGNRTFEYEWLPGEAEGYPATKEQPIPGEFIPARPPSPGRAAVPPSKSRTWHPTERIPKGQKGAGRVTRMAGYHEIDIPGRPEVLPRPAAPAKQIVTFDQAMQIIDATEKLGHDMSSGGAGKILYDKTGVPVMMRGIARRLARVVADDMKAMPGLENIGKAWGDAKFKDMLANTLSSLFGEEGTVRGTKLGVPEIQKAATSLREKGYYHDFIELMGEKDGHDFLTNIMNGADPRSSPSVRGSVNPYIRQHDIITRPTVGWHLPTLPFFAGPPGPAVWRGMFPVMKRLGPNVVARMLLEASGMEEPYDDAPMMRPSP